MPVPVAEINKVSFGFGQRLVLEDVSFEIQEGASTCVIGPNGGGKTTLLRLILGLLTPSKGSIRIFGRPPVEARRDIGYVPQAMRFDPLFPASTLDIVLMGRLDRVRFGFYGSGCRAAAEAALEEVGLADSASSANVPSSPAPSPLSRDCSFSTNPPPIST